MSHIDDMVRDLCPDGVVYRALGETGSFVRGHGLQKRDFVDSGYPCIHYGQVHTHYGVSATETISFVAIEHGQRLRQAMSGDLVIATTSEDDNAVGKAVAWLGPTPVAVGGDAVVFKHEMDPKFVSYFFASNSFHDQKRSALSGAKVRRISIAGLSRIKFPVPPLEIQREVVRVLDQFTQLEAELEAELEARRRQYSYYLEDILGTGRWSDVPWLPLSSLGTFRRGKRFTKSDYADEGVPCIHYGEIYTRFGVSTRTVVSHLDESIAGRLRFAEPGDLVIVDVGEVVDDVGRSVAWVGDTPVAIHDHSYSFRGDVNPVFLSYVMRTNWFRRQKVRYIARTKVNTLLIDGFSRIRVPVPSVVEQERVVEVLNDFDALVNDLGSGIPAEIAARRRQYEYYRDRLFDFPERR